MSTVSAAASGSVFNNGDRLTRAEFHHLYERAPDDLKAELIGGVVYVASPLKRPHGWTHLWLSALYAAYVAATKGVDASDNTTILLGPDAEPQPDLHLRILEEFGGRSRMTDDDYVLGPPELVTEIALSSRSIDLHFKYDDYARYGVLEYLVVLVKEKNLCWFDLAQKRELQPDADGVYRIRTFPGLWIDGAALLAGDYARLMAALQAGLATPEHEQFVRRMEDQRANRTRQ